VYISYLFGHFWSLGINDVPSTELKSDLAQRKASKSKRIWRPQVKQLNAHLLCSFFSPCFSSRSRVCIFESDPHPRQHGSASDSKQDVQQPIQLVTFLFLTKVATASPISCGELSSTIFSTGGIAEAHERPKPTGSSTTATMDPIAVRAPSRYTMAGIDGVVATFDKKD
jgi:hypothetical protein